MDILKTLHITAAIISIGGFVLRGIWMLRQSGWLEKRWVKVAPHIVDTVLLVSAVILVMRVRQYPFVDAWLTAKVLALLVYIGLGMAALRFGKTKQIRLTAFVLAILVFSYIVAVAMSRQAGGGLV